MRLLRRWRHSEQGANVVEFALVLPLLLLVLLGIVECGFVFQEYEVITNAAREGARMAVLPGYGTPQGQTAVIERVLSYVDHGRVPVTGTNPVITLANDTVAVTGLPVIPVKRVTVTYTHTIAFLSAIDDLFDVTYSTIPMTAVSEMRVELGS
jgi:Flp pilus assembly pilin Flp